MAKQSKEEKLEGILGSIDLNEKTEMGEVADQLFRNTPSRSNISNDEFILLFINNAEFKGLGKRCPNFAALNPVNDFLEFKKSVGGWNVQMFVESAGGMQNSRAGGSIGGWFRDKLLTPK